MISVQLAQEFVERLVEDVLFDWWPDITATTVHIPGVDDGYARVIEVQPGEWKPVARCQVWIQPPCAMKPPSSPLPRCEQCVGYLTNAGLPDPAELALHTKLRLPPDGTRPVFSRAPSH
ncbi:hypothetical protein [Saccharopolyspora sp. ASAGF58]|uniref:hypothetical protein n=1 Tax=Saccharopolyspora sp. ASAGF58 TaxID=2719023 RepID=UPI001B30DC09|nr:hypothetical protein [Saccharopolyspora sp. ASAGF58]